MATNLARGMSEENAWQLAARRTLAGCPSRHFEPDLEEIGMELSSTMIRFRDGTATRTPTGWKLAKFPT